MKILIAFPVYPGVISELIGPKGRVFYMDYDLYARSMRSARSLLRAMNKNIGRFSTVRFHGIFRPYGTDRTPKAYLRFSFEFHSNRAFHTFKLSHPDVVEYSEKYEEVHNTYFYGEDSGVRLHSLFNYVEAHDVRPLLVTVPSDD